MAMKPMTEDEIKFSYSFIGNDGVHDLNYQNIKSSSS
jgi:hypothetical protein